MKFTLRQITFFIILSCNLFSGAIFCQDLQITNNFWGRTQYFHGSEKIDIQEFEKILATSDEAHQMYEKSKKSRIYGLIMIPLTIGSAAAYFYLRNFQTNKYRFTWWVPLMGAHATNYFGIKSKLELEFAIKIYNYDKGNKITM